MPKSVPEPAETFKEIRTKVFTTNYRKFGLAPTEKHPNVWGALMEIGYPQAVVTLICMIDGTANLYFSNGGGVTGGGGYEAVRMKAEEFILAAETSLKKLNKAKNFPLPETNRVRFYALTFSGIYTGQDNQNIADESRDLFPLFRAGHEVIAAMRQVDEAGKQKSGNEAGPGA